jgi:hypothetical protein
MGCAFPLSSAPQETDAGSDTQLFVQGALLRFVRYKGVRLFDFPTQVICTASFYGPWQRPRHSALLARGPPREELAEPTAAESAQL